ncbi:hypothetical protein N2599_23705 (plasmid) [Rhizobium sullae]|uniref:Uncharacterized protein n=2 Tax=Rhizobium sullae TaxID=50338 RepID=A0A2N0D833_RHISU|nr:hypothetical protein [Rhizobium sullae]PKA42231.1 hypothetical protein CWR43_19205 [Rhizobium sullae]UWU18262.1 hypothetical protein N2599_23705 [Rhizobium sullae]
MHRAARIPDVISHDEHIVTAREALEGLYLKLEQELEVRLVAAALRAGWQADEAMEAIAQLRNEDLENFEARSRPRAEENNRRRI